LHFNCTKESANLQNKKQRCILQDTSSSQI